ncbi:hypothetical protein QBC41DRAFT_328095 [Cercophora samala]|uniref:Uncharacterized protein n=1 Tax=Cercophora samala TaxID=330535 RepID=A0AA40D729_9PEZI|nr:hypothetical protein QBC41DRAFT_328095 [Cercophora samala]
MSYSAFQESLQDLTSPGAVTAAVQKWVQMAQQQQPGDDLGDWMWLAWNAVISAAENTPVEQQDGLLLLLVELRKQEVPNRSVGDQKLWKDLPNLGMVARDAYNFGAFSPDSPEEGAKNDRLVGFLARLTGAVARDIDVETNKAKVSGDFALFGLWTLREVFEGIVDEQGRALGEKEFITADGELVQGADAQIASHAVNQASLWILGAGDYLWKLSKANTEFEQNLGIPGPHFKNRGWRGFNKERWAVWKRGFEKAQEWVVGEEAKKRVSDVVEKLAKLE